MNEENLIASILKEFRKEEMFIRKMYAGDTHYRAGIVEGIRLAEIIIKQQIRNNT